MRDKEGKVWRLLRQTNTTTMAIYCFYGEGIRDTVDAI
jgi:hypothetical protein